VILAEAATLPKTAADPAWQTAPQYVAKLIAQDLVEPRLIKLSTPEVRVRALTDGNEMAFRLEWNDETKNDLPRLSMFMDACAIQVPAKIEPTLPAPQMGEPGRPVEIVMWNAAWQAIVDGRGDTIKDIYPRASIDHYPFQAKSLEQGSPEQRAMADRYAPARALRNMMTGPRDTPVQELVAEGPGTLVPREATGSTGHGERTADGWAVVIRRKLSAGLSAQTGSQIAFAVWEAGHEEVGARKMRTGWIPLVMQK
jgi:hypothetical protein